MSGRYVLKKTCWTLRPFAKEMQTEKGVAVGIINSSWGGPPIAAWSTRHSLEKHKNFQAKLASGLYSNPDYPDSVKRADKMLADQWNRQQSGRKRKCILRPKQKQRIYIV